VTGRTGVWRDPLRPCIVAPGVVASAVVYPPPKTLPWSLYMLRRLWAIDGRRTRFVAPAHALEALTSAFPDRAQALAAIECLEAAR
jgi:hypothetical protein